MPKSQTSDLTRFLKPFPPDVRARALELRAFVWDLYPDSNELIYDNYNALAIGWSVTDRVSHVFCNLALGRTSHNVHFGFYWGSKIKDPRKLLMGNGKQWRYITVHDMKDFPAAYMKALMKEAYAYSLSCVKQPEQLLEGKTIVKSVSAAKRTKGTKVVNKKH